MSIFAKRHYEAIALTMQQAHPGERMPARLDTWHLIRQELADTFKADSSQFNEPRFIVACLPGHNVRARTQHLQEKTQEQHRANYHRMARS